MILTWNHDLLKGRIAKDDFNWFDTIVRPDLGFEYVGLYYEQPTASIVKYDGTTFVQLTSQEVIACQNYINAFDFTNTGQHVCDDKGFYIGKLPPSQISDTMIVTTQPPSDGFMWNLETSHWEEIFGIDQTGNLVRRPAIVKDLRIIFTSSDIEMFPAAPHYRFNFDTNTWYDPRGLDDAKDSKKELAHQFYERRREQIIGFIGVYGLYTLKMQYEESLLPETSPTPFIDKCLSFCETTRETLITNVQSSYTAILNSLGEIEGKLLFKIDEIDAALTIEAVDSIKMEA